MDSSTYIINCGTLHRSNRAEYRGNGDHNARHQLL
jgi:hypothetical protein